MEYQASIKNITRGTYLRSENHGEIRYTKDADKRLIFYDKDDAEDILAMIEDCSSDCYTLCLE